MAASKNDPANDAAAPKEDLPAADDAAREVDPRSGFAKPPPESGSADPGGNRN